MGGARKHEHDHTSTEAAFWSDRVLRREPPSQCEAREAESEQEGGGGLGDKSCDFFR